MFHHPVGRMVSLRGDWHYVALASAAVCAAVQAA
eukprot:COSAG05_NODE_21684_length_270_cov_0.602339_1_plen_33_part_10